MIPTRRQLIGTGAVAVGAAASLTACTTPVAVAPRRHTYSLRQSNGYRRDLVVCDPAGHGSRDILQSVFGRAAWTPDGGHLCVARGAADDSLGTWALWVLRSDGSLLHRITNPASGVADLDPAFAPDGQTIAFSRDTVGFGTGAGSGSSRPTAPACTSSRERPAGSPQASTTTARRWSTQRSTASAGSRPWAAPHT